MDNAVTDQGTGGGDGLRTALAVALIIAGLVGFYVLRDHSEWIRWLAVVGGLAAGAAVYASSNQGRSMWRFVLDSRIELRKVVWPTRQESLMTTAVVLVFVVVAGLFFWFLDLLLAFLTKWITGPGA